MARVTPYVLHISAADKYGLIGAAGFVLALRDMGFLQHCKVIVGSGLGNILVARMAQAVFQRGRLNTQRGCSQAWQELTTQIFDRSTSVDFLSELVLHPLMLWCLRNQEWEMFTSRACRWREMLSPWAVELARLIDRETEGKYTWEDVWKFTTKHQHEEEVPLLCLTAARRGSPDPQGLSTYKHAISSSRVAFVGGRGKDADKFSAWLAASVMPEDRFGSLPQRWGKGPARMLSVLGLDPLGEEACITYYHRLRLNRKPSGPTRHEQRFEGGQLLLFDGITDSPWVCRQESDHISSVLFNYHSRVTMRRRDNDDTLRACRQQIAQFYDAIPHAENNDPDVAGLRKFIGEVHLRPHGFSSVDTDLALNSINLGYVRGYYAYGQANTGEIPIGMPNKRVGDDYMFRHALYSKSRWNRLRRMRRTQVLDLPGDGELEVKAQLLHTDLEPHDEEQKLRHTSPSGRALALASDLTSSLIQASIAEDGSQTRDEGSSTERKSHDEDDDDDESNSASTALLSHHNDDSNDSTRTQDSSNAGQFGALLPQHEISEDLPSDRGSDLP